MADEQTPLFLVRQRPRRLSSLDVCCRFLKISLSCSAIILAVSVVSFLFVSPFLDDYSDDYHGTAASLRSSAVRHRHQELRRIMLDTPSSSRSRQWSQYYTSGAHLAGQNLSQALWTLNRWEKWGIKSEIVPYEVYLNSFDKPSNHSLTLLSSSDERSSWTVLFEATLEEDVLDNDPTRPSNGVPTFNGYSPSGNVTASFIWANYGTYQDFDDLIHANVSLQGKIAIVRYGHVFRGLKVKRAQELGMLACILYSDPGDDGDVTEEKGVATYPEGPARNPSSVQRGSVGFISIRTGDPTTPGYPSKPGVPRASGDDCLPSIPTIPISFADAVPILRALNGHGLKASNMNSFWNRNLGLTYRGVDYHIGPSPDSVTLNLFSQNEFVISPIWNVVGMINGSLGGEVVVVGCHRDAWIVGGAGDPISGVAALNEIVRSFGVALNSGWKPLRTIVFASWDGEEPGLLGSTEWVEEFMPWLSSSAVAYLNLDKAVAGTAFWMASHPLMYRILKEAAQSVMTPTTSDGTTSVADFSTKGNSTQNASSLLDLWDGRFKDIGSGSDFTAFQDLAGIPSVFPSFQRRDSEAVYHYHSNYDSFHWMATFGDPSFGFHRASAQFLGLVAAEVANRPIIPFSAYDYAEFLRKRVEAIVLSLHELDRSKFSDAGLLTRDEITAFRGAKLLPQGQNESTSGDATEQLVEALQKLSSAVSSFIQQASKFDHYATKVSATLQEGIPWWRFLARSSIKRAVVQLNTGYKLLDRHFLYAQGLEGRPWYKHVAFAPGLWTGYSGAVLPSLVESVQAGDYEAGIRWSRIVQSCVEAATESLKLTDAK